MYNINEPTGKTEWEKCRALLDYSKFVSLVNEEQRADANGFMERAIRDAKKLGILTDFLSRNAKEVENMFFGEYDYDMDIAVQRGEAFDDGKQQGIAIGIAEGEERGIAQGERNAKFETARNLLAMHLGTAEQIAQASGLTLSEVLALKEQLTEAEKA